MVKGTRLFFRAAVIMALFGFFPALESSFGADGVLDIGSSRQLFIDDYLVDSMEDVELRVHQPARKEVAVTFGSVPWEGDSQNYFTILQDGQRFHMYYHAWGQVPTMPLSIAYMRSEDGIHWERPNLGLCEFEGSKENNIVLFGLRGYSSHDFNPFVDEKPGTPPESKFKAVGMCYGGPKGHGLFAFQSPDGIHWTEIKEGPVFQGPAFDTQNVAFWSVKENCYVLFYREFRDGIRIVRKAVSDNLTEWREVGEILFPEGEGPTLATQFYTNQIFPYYRNKELYIGFPARYTDRGETPGTWDLPEPELRRERMERTEPRLGTTTTDSVFISSRDGIHFTESDDVFVPPGLRTAHNWVYGDNYLAWSVIETASADDDSPNELSLYSTESYATGGDSRLRRYTLRIDGFSSLHAKSKVGVARTKPFTFKGSALSLNAATSGAGNIYVEICDASGAPLPGFAMDDCDVVFGDFLDRRVTWKGKGDLSRLAGQPILLRFRMNEADIYSLQFVD